MLLWNRRTRGMGPALIWTMLVTGAPATGQIPDSFTNLQVLPEDISQQDLLVRMKGASMALGVRCVHCHVGGPELADIDFASDDKAPKAVARAMMRMLRAINDDLLPAPSADTGLRVTCNTCHRGETTPGR